MQPCKTGDQPYSDASPNSECSLAGSTLWTQLLDWHSAFCRIPHSAPCLRAKRSLREETSPFPFQELHPETCE